MTAHLQNRDDSSMTLTSAMAFMDEHAASPMTITDIASAAHVSARSVQYAFAAVGSTPLRYLRKVRLSRAHADLEAGRREEGASVTEIALVWGFGHQGRFAAAYRAAYGVPPVVTLRS